MLKAMTMAGILTVMLIFGRANAADKASAPATSAAVIGADDKDALKAAVDKDATVEGTVSSAGWASERVFLIKFKEAKSTGFVGVVFSKDKDAMTKGLGGELSAAVNGAKIQLHGKVTLYRGKPEIVLSQPSQVTMIVKGTGVASPAPQKPATRPATSPAK